MNPIRNVARFAALATAVAIVASCDTRLTASGPNALDDIERPQIQFALSSGASNSADVGTPLTVDVTGTDDFGVAFMLTRVSNGAQVLGVDTATIKPSAKLVTRTVPVQLSGLTSGSKITIRATISDGATNEKTDSIVVTLTDTAGPAMTVLSAKALQAVKGTDTLGIRVTATDSSGIVYAGYRLLRVRTTDSVQIKADSSYVPTGTKLTNFQTPPYSYVVPDTLLPGSYTLVGFAKDRSGMTTKAGKPGLPFTITDGLKPTLTFLTPVAGAQQKVGDPLPVTVRVQDGIAVQKLTLEGVSVRVLPSGADTTIVRYPLLQTTFRSGLRDTTISRSLQVGPAPIDTGTDILTVTGILTDLAGNADTVRVKLQMVP